MKRTLIIIGVLALALGLYYVGFSTSAVAVLVLAGCAEFAFWVMLFAGLRKSKPGQKSSA